MRETKDQKKKGGVGKVLPIDWGHKNLARRAVLLSAYIQ